MKKRKEKLILQMQNEISTLTRRGKFSCLSHNDVLEALILAMYEEMVMIRSTEEIKIKEIPKRGRKKEA